MKIFIIIINLLFCNIISAQDNVLIAKGASPDLYITHTVSLKENFYSIGRLYNISPKQIAPYNNLALEKGLSPDQVIKIPLNQTNFYQGDAADQSTMMPVYHVIEPREGLYHVSTTYNKVSTELLKKWNNLQTDVVSNGTKLIIGYINVKGQLTAQQKTINNNGDNVVTTSEATKSATAKAHLPKDKEVDSNKISSEEKKEVVVRNDDPPIKESANQKPSEAVFNKSAINFNGGLFKTMYDDQIRKKSEAKESGLSGVFKSTSGWQDGKYYCFHNSAAPGTIMKVTSASTGKSIYAKVLDLIPDIKQNEGLLLHISNAAAEELGVGENKFDCSVSYAK